MRIVQINATCGVGSTGKICVAVSEKLTKRGIENYILYCGKESDYPCSIQYADVHCIKTEALRSHLNGRYGFNSKAITRRLISHLDKIWPDIIHLHNIHGHNCDLEELFHFLAGRHVKVFWTFHDCWAFTAYCPYFDIAKCDKWRTGCSDCPQYREYSLLFDRSKMLYKKKKELLSDVDMTIVTPSQWLADLVKQSFLKNYPVKVIHNGIDLTIFKPTPSDFRERYHIPHEKKILLGVAFDWGRRKGLDVFVELAARLDPDRYQIVLVGTNSRIDKMLPPQIISVHRTTDQRELAEIYTMADIFVNPTREENYPTVNMESIACGTPVLTYRTGGSPEIPDEKTGTVVDCDDVDALECEIIRISEEQPFTCEDCLARAKQFDAQTKYMEYVELYE